MSFERRHGSILELICFSAARACHGQFGTGRCLIKQDFAFQRDGFYKLFDGLCKSVTPAFMGVMSNEDI